MTIRYTDPSTFPDRNDCWWSASKRSSGWAVHRRPPAGDRQHQPGRRDSDKAGRADYGGNPSELDPDQQAQQESGTEQEPNPVQRSYRPWPLVGHDPAGDHERHEAERKVDQEDPRPGGDRHDPATQGRREHRSEQCRPRQVGRRVQEISLRRGPQHDESADRHHHRAADPLQDPGDDEHRQADAEGTEGGGHGEGRDGHEQDPPTAEAVGEPAADGDANGDGHQVGGDGDVDVDRADAQVVRHLRCRSGDDRGVQVLHEERPGHQQRQRPVQLTRTTNRHGR
jgi:hypothetical protein